jgi:hypothetical protein
MMSRFGRNHFVPATEGEFHIVARATRMGSHTITGVLWADDFEGVDFVLVSEAL